jgi:hypothetical protein
LRKAVAEAGAPRPDRARILVDSRTPRIGRTDAPEGEQRPAPIDLPGQLELRADDVHALVLHRLDPAQVDRRREEDGEVAADGVELVPNGGSEARAEAGMRFERSFPLGLPSVKWAA